MFTQFTLPIKLEHREVRTGTRYTPYPEESTIGRIINPRYVFPICEYPLASSRELSLAKQVEFVFLQAVFNRKPSKSCL